MFPAADVLVLERVLHNWDLAMKKMMLKKAHYALRPAVAVIVSERLIDDERRSMRKAFSQTFTCSS